MFVTRPGRQPRALHRGAALAAALFLALPTAASAQRDEGDEKPTIEEHTEDMERLDGFFPLYLDREAGELFMEIDRWNEEVLHVAGMGSGLGSNDIGIDRGSLTGSEIVFFERAGPRVLMIQPNYRFRSSSGNPAEVQAVADAFARSTLYGFPITAVTGERVLIPMNEFLLRDSENMGNRMGGYRYEASRSRLWQPMIQNFPLNTEMEVELTFVPGGGGGGGGGAFFEGVGSVASTSAAANLRLHHSFVELPDEGYETRIFDPRSGYGSVGWEDYSAPLGEAMTQRFTRRHRLEKVDPTAAVSDPVEPIVYYLDPGVPEPVRSALLEGAGWWNQAFEGAGYRNAFQVEILPEDVSPLDIRYNVINWAHRSTRGWSYGSSVTDPRTGEIIKGVVTLGSLRIRQDYLLAEGILAPYETGYERPPELEAWAVARIRQLSAHEVGHTIGLGHNYYDSNAGRISVLDYPHPLVTLNSDGTFDHSEVYEHGIGEWDSVAVAWGYQDFPPGVDERAALDGILDAAWERDIRYLSNQDISVHPRVDQWSNGVNGAVELRRLMEVRRVALDRFGERAIQAGTPLATMEEVLVPLYLWHRYQLDAAGSALGGQEYIYSFRGDGRMPFQRVSGAHQREVLDALLATLTPQVLALPRVVVDRLPPRPSGWGRHREMFPRWTGSTFDVITPAVVAAELTVGNILDNSKAARLVEQNAVDPSLPGLGEVLDRLIDAVADAPAANPYQAEIRRAVERVALARVMGIAANADMPQARALAMQRVRARQTELAAAGSGTDAQAAHAALLAEEMERFIEDPEGYAFPSAPSAPPGAPIGEPAMRWLEQWAPGLAGPGGWH